MEKFKPQPLPTTAEELNRKCLDELERLVTSRDYGEISEAQFQSSMLTMFNCVYGLVNSEVSETINEVVKDIQKDDHSFWSRRTFKDKDGGIKAMVQRQSGKLLFIVTLFTRPTFTRKVYKFSGGLDDRSRCIKSYNAVIDKMLEIYEEIK